MLADVITVGGVERSDVLFREGCGSEQSVVQKLCVLVEGVSGSPVERRWDGARGGNGVD